MGTDKDRGQSGVVSASQTLTPALSRGREREQVGEQKPVSDKSSSDSLSRERERAGVRVRVRARALRNSQTDAEALLWSRLRARQVGNLKFRRQRPIGLYFADFACMEVGLVIELDGGQHAEESGNRNDQKRSDAMAVLGFQTLRFWNHEVLTETNAVLEKILQIAETLTPAPSRLRERGQENTQGTPP